MTNSRKLIDVRNKRRFAPLTIAAALTACIILAGCKPMAPGNTNVPGAPTGTSVIAVPTGDGQVAVSWNAVKGATSYNLYWASGSSVTTTTGTKIAKVSSPAIVDNIPQGKEYSFAVTAVNSGGEGSASSAVKKTLSTTTEHVYATGNVGGYPVYWKDGVVYPLGSTVGYSGDYIAVSPTGGIFVACDTSSAHSPTYWDNGTMVSLSVPAGTTFAWFGGIALSGTDVYISGTVTDNTSGNQLPVYWKDGTLYSLSLVGGDTAGYVSGIVVSGGNVYITGTSSSSTDGNIVYWENDSLTPTVLSQGAGDGYGWNEGGSPGTAGILYAGSNFYFYGTTYTSNGGEPVYWENAVNTPTVQTSAPIAGYDYVAFSMAVSGSNIYFSGDAENDSNNTVGTPGYFLNGTPNALPLPSGVTNGSGDYIVVVGTDVYVLGEANTRLYDNASRATAIPLLWKNGTLQTVQLPSGDANVIMSGMVASGTDVYFAGTTGTYGSGNLNYSLPAHPVYWKNNNMNVFPLNGKSSGHVNVVTTFPY